MIVRHLHKAITIYPFTFVFVLFVLSNFIFHEKAFGYEWFLGAFFFIFLFFYLVQSNSIQWKWIQEKSFTQRLFISSIILRILALIIISVIAETVWDHPFYIGSADAPKYHRVAIETLEFAKSSNLTAAVDNLYQEYEGIDDFGFPVFLAFLYSFTFKSVYLAKIILIIISSFTVVQGYKLTRLLWDESTARLSGLILMAFPLSLFYSVVLLKENLITFLIVNLAYLVTRSLIKHKINILYIVLFLIHLAALFFLRTAIGALMALIIPTAFIVNHYKGSKLVSILAGISILAGFILLLNYLGYTQYYVNKIQSSAEGYGLMRTEIIQQTNTWISIGSAPLYFVLAHFAPFPTLINFYALGYFDTVHGAFNYYIPGVIVWNILALFSLYGIIKTLSKEHRRKNIMLWGIAIGYMIILVKTVMFTSVRISYSSMPILLILAAIGINHTKAYKYWRVYLLIMGITILAWNVFKLGGRGLI